MQCKTLSQNNRKIGGWRGDSVDDLLLHKHKNQNSISSTLIKLCDMGLQPGGRLEAGSQDSSVFRGWLAVSPGSVRGIVSETEVERC